ncbi:MAG: bifunctional phosphopantothenoylcysteine decarboxylase/phosphopantothenate--cysteine ligase CoaBC [Candidatus Zixiibacteriota bacterium]
MDPEEGELACHTVGVGRMAEPEAIFSRVVSFLSEKKSAKRRRTSETVKGPPESPNLAGRKVVVTAGPCREKLDPVRHISNHSSGRMGYALAAAARESCADVTLISGPTELAPPDDVAFIAVESTSEMLDAVLSHIDCADALLMAAAPADYTPESARPSKIKKQDSALTLALVRTPDILRQVARVKKDNLTVIGFALESENLVENARRKLEEKNLDLIVANSAVQPGSGPGGMSNQATIIGADGQITELPLMPKRELATEIISRLVELVAAPHV